jgi:hypothetical protein
MSKEKINIITKLINSVNLRNLNLNLINKNCNYLYELQKNIKIHWNNKKGEHKFLESNEDNYKKIFKITKNSLLGDYPFVINELKKTNKIVYLKESTIDFYYFDLGNYEKDIELIDKLFNQSVCLAKFKDLYNKKDILIIWIPVNKKRDFHFSHINDETILKSIANFNAFTASGVTFGNIPKITLISRYEEISKLLLHELIHNYNLDGSMYHDHNHEIIKNYKNIKNPTTKLDVYNYDYPYSIYESYTELLSSYLSIIFRNILLDSKKDLIERYKTEIIMEILYSYHTISNLIKLNNYKNYDEFLKEKKFKGDICVYEYYYLKGLLYNNYKLELCDNIEHFQKNYEKIININKEDLLLEDIFKNSVKQTNLSYIFFD